MSEEDFEEFKGLFSKQVAEIPLTTHIDALSLRIGTRNTLVSENIETIGDLVEMTEAKLRNIPNIGPKDLTCIIKESLAEFGLGLKKF